jgi:hypothetical protein
MARSTPADYREFVRVSVDLPLNPKLAMLDEPACGWAYVVSLCYCGQNLTDGSFPMVALLRLAGVGPDIARLLVDAGLWHEAGHSCERCPQPLSGMGVVHDYLEHQRSAEEAKALRDTRREAGRKGAATRWSTNGDGKSHGKSQARAMASAMANGWQDDGKTMAEVEVEEEKKTSSSSSRPEPRREDVDSLCKHLQDRVRANGSKGPTAAEAEGWRRAARLMLDKDGRSLTEAHTLIDWCQDDDFWRGNVLSMPKFRKQYDQLRLKAQTETGGRHLNSVRDQPELRTFEDYVEHFAGEQAARLLRKPYLPEPQPPGDRTHPRQWARDQALAFLTAHEDQIRDALTHQETA